MLPKITIICIISILFLSFTELSNYKINTSLIETSVKLYCPEPALCLVNQSLSKDPDKIDMSTKEINLQEDVDANWFDKVVDDLQKEEYNISYFNELKSYHSVNRANNINFIFNCDGFTAKAVQSKTEKWSVDFKMMDLRRGNKELQIANYLPCRPAGELQKFYGDEIRVDGNKAYVEDSNIRIDYTNDEKGMRQDFTIKNKLQGEGKLRLNLSVKTKLKMIAGADALMFKDNNGEEKMKYSALKCWDAKGTELRAYFEDNYELQVSNYKPKVVNRDLKIDNLKSKIPALPSGRKNPKSSIPILKSFSIVVNDEDAIYPITIDPLSTSPNWSVEGNTNEALGVKAATAGDVNGDGYSDVLISLGDSVIYAYYGSSTGLPLLNNWSARGFGFSSISTAGDVNADGFSDIIIGDGAYSVQGPFKGRALAYYGSSTGLSLSPNWTVYDSSNADGALFGSSVSTAGDVNGDGYSDVIVGAPYYTGNENYEGAVLCYFGSSTGLSLTSNWKIEGNTGGQSYHFGEAISLAGDVNGDGYSDILVGAPNWSINRGRVYAYYGSSSGLPATHNWTTFSTQIHEVYGSSVSTAGDVNGDGYSDIIIGARGYDGDSIDEGRVYVYHGSSAGLSASYNWAAEGNRYNSNFGHSVSSAGDINGDGYADILVGANFYSNTLSTQGRAFMYQGSATGLPGNANWTTDGEQTNSLYGSGLFTAGDVNGDGYSDVIVGAPGYSTNKGKAYLYNGAPSGLTTNIGWQGNGESGSALYGFSVSTAGDVNGDGYSDVIVGAYAQQISSQQRGRAYVYHGSATGLLLTPNWTGENNQVNSQFGYSVSTAGDVNGDGYSDVIIGSPFFDNDQDNEGRAYVYYGSSSGLSLSPNWTGESNIGNARYSYSLSTGGDVNGDGYSDVIVGQYGANTAYVYHGSSTGLSTTANWTSSGELFFGICVATAGDVNGDGYSDVIVGSNGDFDKGKAYAFYGSQNGLSLTSNWTRSGQVATENFSFSVACAGDVNGDGYSDVIIGAKRYNNTGFAYAGGAFAYHGSPSGLSGFTNWFVEGDGFNTRDFGISVSSAGDVNGDGYSDVIVGAPNPGGFAYSYYGSSSGLSGGPNWTLNSVFYGNVSRFGTSVSSAGDVNGDGYSDVIVGAHLFPPGKAFMYYGNEGAGLKRTVQQYKPGSNSVVSSGGLTGMNGSVKYGIYGRSPYGRSNGKIVYDHKISGVPFTSINSSANSGSGLSYLDLGTSGIELTNDASGLQSTKEYKWRARVQYDPINNPYQKLGPWKYYNTHIPLPVGNFKPRDSSPLIKQFTLKVFMEGFYRLSTHSTIRDTVRVYFRNAASPYEIVDSGKMYIDTNGTGTCQLNEVQNGVAYYIATKHRNSMETWSNTIYTFTNSILNFDFTYPVDLSYDENMVRVDNSPIAYAMYSGDVDQDGIIDAADLSLVDNDAFNAVSGYVSTDVNGDNFVDASDLSIVDNNAFLGIMLRRP